MKKLATVIAAIALIGTPAFAADMPVKAPPPPPAPVYNWTGWYVGVNAGASFGNVKTDFNVTPGTSAVTEGESFSTGIIPGFAGSDRVNPDGFMGGGQIGYNWQLSPIWVAGFEADFQGADERGGNTFTSNFSEPLFFSNGVPSGFTATGTTALDYTAKIEWFGTARLRAGYVWGNGNVMSYVTAGLAYGKVDVTGTSALTANVVVPLSITQSFDHSNVNTGWVIGTGTEGVIDFWGARNWTWKIEGLYMDLGHLDATGPGGSTSFAVGPCPSPVSPGCFIATSGPATTHSHFTDGILRAGLNYQFH
jgi:outer membrane immunogenic protein